MPDPTTQEPLVPVELHTDRPHPARMYDYYLGGKTNFTADIRAAGEVVGRFPEIRSVARTNRTFLHRAAAWCVQTAGIIQFLDLGTGIPTSPNTHETVQALEPSARVAYVDNDPIVLAHARALLRSTSAGRTGFIQADIRTPDEVWDSLETLGILDLDQPVALVLGAVLHFVPDAPARDVPGAVGATGIVTEVVERLPTGSAVIFSHVTSDHAPGDWARIEYLYRSGGIPAQVRTFDQIAALLDQPRVDLVDPGLVLADRWHPAPDAPQLTPRQVSCYGAVARIT